MKIGIAGSGMIVRVALDALAAIEGTKVTAICVRERSEQTGHELAERYHIDTVHTDYDRMLQDPDVEFIYIGIVNSLHYDYAKRALEAGKHLLVEKPFTSTVEEAQELLELAESKKLYLFEAVVTPYSPDYLKVRELLPEIGRIRLVQSNFSKRSSRYGDYLEGKVLPAFDPALAGGALYDLNIYNLHFTLGLFGRPNDARYIGNLGPNGIDTSGVLTLAYDGFAAACLAGKDSDGDCFTLLQGENGSIRVDGPPNMCSSITLKTREREETFTFEVPDNHMSNEFRAFARMYRNREWEKSMDMLRHSVLVMDIATKARREAGIAFAADTVSRSM
ncbi:Gfo/Idh/MocA family protein [Saccharibacillus endophyticus]|uniref:NAD(P)-dependent oxidoreductase n=1 Tax=Saccharibacillus endophyticus TaxID=2060666 RepID=A0ABQ2A4S2_9BACL|nr:Gfo/Idh/MocA family oxidoreductase [Saccharibacillus endophyticus]GGH84918.1 NAD(P)-dependent oxidoreductase [Saccharibacillus endophyticus]